MGVQLKPKYKSLFKTPKRYQIITGGRGSGKSFTINVFLVLLTYDKGQNILFTRYTMTSTHVSIIPEFRNAIELLGLEDDFTINKTDITNNKTGNKIYFRGLKTGSGTQTANLKSLSGITCWVLDEAEELTDEEMFDKIDFSIRSTIYQNRVICVLNPSAKSHFIYKKFFTKTDGDTNYIHTTYLDNIEHLNEALVKRWHELKLKDPDKYDKVIMGNWGGMENKGFYRNFRYDVHVTDCRYNPELDIHISIDDNDVPFSFLGVYQEEKRGDKTVIKVVDEFALFDTNVEGVMKAFLAKYNQHKMKTFFYADATSNKGSSVLEKNSSFNKIAFDRIKTLSPIWQVPKSNPSVIDRGDWINSVLADLETIVIEVSDQCNVTYEDFENLQVQTTGSDIGKKDKSIFNDTKRGIKYQRQGHATDSFEYYITKRFVNEYMLFKTGSLSQKPIIINHKGNSGY